MKKFIILSLLSLTGTCLLAQPPKNLSLLGSLAYPGQSLSGVWHYNDTSGNEYALVGASDGISIVDITNPALPVELFQLPGVYSIWHEVKVQGDFAYAVSEGVDTNGTKNGMQIIDLRYLPDSAPHIFYKGDGLIANQLQTAHSITTAGHYVYVNGHNIFSMGRGVLILDITDPLAPAYVGAITARYCHDSYVRGDTIYTSDISDGLFTIYDITDPALPVQLATQQTPGFFNHNTWLSDDGLTIFTTDEHGNEPLGAYDISDFSNITLIDTFFNGYFKANEVHNVRVLNDFLINPSYGSQLTIADAMRPANIIEIANYTTGNGLCWDADPYTNSGNIIATDKNPGMLYIFAPDYIRACYLEGNITDSITGFPIANANVVIQSISIADFSDLLGNYKTGYADSGTYVVAYSKAGYDTKQLQVNLQHGILTIQDVELVPAGTSIHSLEAHPISIFPNPAVDFVIVQDNSTQISSWELVDNQGRIVLQNSADFKTTERVKIDLSGISKGIYTIRIQRSEGTVIRQISRL